MLMLLCLLRIFLVQSMRVFIEIVVSVGFVVLLM